MSETVTVTEAARRLGVSRTKVWTMVRDGELQAFPDPLDKRQRLIEVQAIKQIQARRGAARPYPRSIGMVSDGTVQSKDMEEYMEAHWKPDWRDE
jgi:excisionase family DNA binding protein